MNKKEPIVPVNTEDLVRSFILRDHPCVMAQSVVADNNVTVHSYGEMIEASAKHILIDLKLYFNEIEEKSKKFQTFIAVFEKSVFNTELQFENALWNLLNALHKMDNCKWDQDTSPDPEASNFSFSLLGHSFYIVGLHPKSSRMARASPVPMIVFNLHNQFEMLRKAKRYERVRDLIRRRDNAYQGSINPMLEDFGTNSEARQYSGRAVDKNWKCPFKFNK